MKSFDTEALRFLKGTPIFLVYRIGIECSYNLLKDGLEEYSGNGIEKLQFMFNTRLRGILRSKDEAEFIFAMLKNIVRRLRDDKRIIQIIDDLEEIKSGKKIVDLTDQQVVDILREFNTLASQDGSDEA